MKKTNKISINGTVKGVSSTQLADFMTHFLKAYSYSKEKYKLILHDDGDNVDINFNDATGFEIHFQGQKYDKDGFLVCAFNDKYDINAMPILKSIVDFFDTKNILYNIEIQYEYDNGVWEDEGFFVHPNFKWE